MKKIRLKEIQLSNWRSLNVKAIFTDTKTTISGKNELGKSSLFHAWCWLLSGYTDSVNVKNYNLFDENKPITPNTPVACVKCKITIDAIEYTLERRAKATFKRTRGTDEYIKSSSDTYILLIDDIEVSVSNWNQFIDAHICNNDMITYLLSGDFFANLAIEDKNKARLVLQSIVGQITDNDYKGDYSCLSPQLAKGYTLQQIEEQAKNRKSDLDKQLSSIPALIENKENTLAEYLVIDYNDINNQITDKKKKIEDIDNAIADKNSALEPIIKQRAEILNKISSIKLKLSECRNTHISKQNAATVEIKSKIQNIECNNALINKHNEEKMKIRRNQENLLRRYKEELKTENEYHNSLLERKDEIKARIFTEDKCVCCGQDLPETLLEIAKNKFNADKQKDLDYIISRGKNVRANIDDLTERISNLEKELSKDLELEDLISINELQQDLKHAESKFVDFSQTEQFFELNRQIEELKAMLPEVVVIDNHTYTEQKRMLMSEIDLLNQQLGLQNQCDKLRNEIASLESQRREIANNIATLEQILAKVKEKREEEAQIVSERINSRLSNCKIEMFRTQKDGSVAPDCIVRGKRGVRYATINNSAKTLINIELQKLMMSHFNVQLPIWIDECKNFDSEHLPNIDGQSIMMFASDSPTLVIE